ncbi:efflux transporter outer membrane subunit [Qipengyuania flava]|uniref:efflux transporter outer membrane subunit n=1 Tax=Qipengyuania flava TaxID=192812 RepID=UPI001C637A23|nr:efflux transporter outer membrane subunit [Qipengyuania flava]QYJ08333.1 efflux transporter outer membrane subunit [Qipengyuania flava]
MSKPPFKLVSAVAMATLLAGCSTVRAVNDERAEALAAESVPPVPDQWTSVRERVGPVDVGWIAAFNDPVLTALVEEAQRNNRNLQAAAASVRRANAFARQAGAPLLPSVGLSADAARTEVFEGPGSGNRFGVGLQVSYEVDLWGRIAAGEAAAIASAQAAEADYIFAQYSIAASVARTYFLVIESREQADVAAGIVDALTEIVRIVNLRFRYGFASEYDTSLAEADLQSARDSLAAARNGEIEALRALEALVGRYPAGLLETAENLPGVPPPPGAGLPSQLLERRPDVIAAERDVAAALNSLSVARAARLPSLSLSTSVGGSSAQLENILDPVNLAWTLAGNLLAPIFQGGALDAQVDIAQADVDAAAAIYADTAINAFTEVESALDRGVFLRTRREALETSVARSRNALRLSNLQFGQGEIDLFDVLGTQQRVFGAESSLLAIKRAQLNQYVELSLALGGDWRNATPIAVEPEQ